MNNTKQTHCHCCRPLVGVDHSDCGRVIVDAAAMAALNAIVLPRRSRKGAR